MDTTDYNYGQSSKNGNVVKCPSCGAPVKVGSLVCPECGHEFRNVKANATVTKFTEELNSLRRAGGAMGFVLDAVGDKRRVAFIEDYPIPDSLDDVLELMLLAKSNADKDGLPEQRAYWTMFCRCVDKVKSSGMQSDPRFVPLLDFYKKNAKKKNVGGMVTLFFFLLFVIGFVCWQVYVIYSLSKSEDNIKQAITAQQDSLLTVIDGLPAPTKDNCSECAYRITKLSWRPVDCRYGGKDEDEKALMDMQTAAEKAVAKKKNAYIRLLNGLKVLEPIPVDAD